MKQACTGNITARARGMVDETKPLVPKGCIPFQLPTLCRALTTQRMLSPVASTQRLLPVTFSGKLTSLQRGLGHQYETVTSDKRVQIQFAHWFDSFTLTWPLSRFRKNE